MLHDARRNDLLARLACHELAGPLLVQRQLLAVARSRLLAAGCRCEEVDLAAECTQDMLEVLELLGALAGREPARPATLGDLLHRTTRGRDRVRLSCTRPAGAALVDGPRTGAVLTNLLNNAEMHGPTSPVSLRAVGRRGGAVVELRQDGDLPDGVDGALHSCDPPPGRPGLGLWLVRHLADQMDARLRCGRVGNGQAWTLRLTLPMLPAGRAVTAGLVAG